MNYPLIEPSNCHCSILINHYEVFPHDGEILDNPKIIFSIETPDGQFYREQDHWMRTRNEDIRDVLARLTEKLSYNFKRSPRIIQKLV